jgi:Domain of unknown function (DUF4326)
MQPIRLQLSRAKGFDLQAHSHQTNGLHAVVVARPTKWRNPWSIAEVGSAEEAVRRFQCAVVGYLIPSKTHPQSTIGKIIADAPKSLRGKNLACWCAPDHPCHADVLLEIANR